MPGIGILTSPFIGSSGRSWNIANNYVSSIVVVATSDTTQTITPTIVGTKYDGVSFEYSTDGINYSVKGTTTGGVYSATELTSGTLYYWRARLYKGSHYGGYSNIDSDITYNAEYITYVTGLTTPLSVGQATNLNTFITTLKTGLGITHLSDFFDAMWVIAGETEESSLKNLVANANHATKVLTPTWTALEGLTPNGSNAYWDSNFIPNTHGENFTGNAGSFGVYIRTNVAEGIWDFGSATNGSAALTIFQARNATDFAVGMINQANTGTLTVASTDSRGFWIVNRPNSTNNELIKNGNSVATYAQAATVRSTVSLKIGAFMYGTTLNSVSTKQFAFAYVGKTVTPSQYTVITDAIETYMTTNNKEVIYESELKTYINGLTTPLSASQKFKINTFVKSLKSGLSVTNLSDIFDTIWLLAGETAESSLKNLVKNSNHCTVIGTTFFSKKHGWKFNGSSHLDTNYNIATQAVKYTQNSSSLGVYKIYDISDGADIGLCNNAGSAFIGIVGKDGTTGYYNNNCTSVLSLTPSKANGLLINSRTEHDVINYYVDGISEGNDTEESATLVSGNIFIGGYNYNGALTYGNYGNLFQFAFASAGLSDTQVTVVKNALNAYLAEDRSQIIAKGGTYDGWVDDGIAAPAVIWDGTSYVLTASTWNDTQAKWATIFFTSPDLKTWTYVTGSLLVPSSGNLLGNSGLAWFDGKFYFAYTHGAAFHLDWSTNLLSWNSVVTAPAIGTDPSLSVNPINGKLELWGIKNYGGVNYVNMYDSTDGAVWTDRGSFPNLNDTMCNYAFGQVCAFYVGTTRYVTHDAGFAAQKRNVILAHSLNRDDVWIKDGVLLTPGTAEWENHQVFDSSIIITDTGDGKGLIPRMVYAGTATAGISDDMDSDLGLLNFEL